MSENSYLITLLQKENQTIIAYELNDKGEYTGVSHTESFFAKANSKWKFTVIPDKFHEDYWIHIIQSDHQTITVRDNARFHDYRAGVLVSYPDDDKLTGIQAGDLNSGIYPETNYDVAVEEPHDRYKYLVVNQNCRIFATLARDLYNNTDYHTISIKQIKHQTIVLTYRNKKYYTDTIVEDNEDYTVELIPDPGYTATSLIINGKTINSLKYTGKATEDLTITAAAQSQAGTDSNYLEFIFKEFDSRIERFNNSDGKLLVGTLQVVAEPEIKTYRVSIVQSTNQTIHVYVPQKNGGTDHTSSFTCLEGTKYEVEVVADNGYTAGIPNTNGGTVNSDITINATPATKSNVTITIIQSANQTIHIYTPYKTGGIDHTSTFTCPVGTTYEAEIIAKSGYTAGTLNVNESGTFSNDITINATAAVALQYTLTITQSAHQTITVTANGKTYTNSVSLPYGTRWTATITPDTGYAAGKLNKTSGIITGDDTVYATTDAIITKLTISVGATTNQTYILNIDGVAKPQTAEASSYSTNYNSHYTVEYIANTATAAYYYTASENVSGVVVSNVTIPAKSATATLRYYTLNIPVTTNQSYTLVLTTNATYGGSLPTYVKTNTKLAQKLSVPYGTKYSIAYTADSGYNAGASKSGTVTSDTNITHNPATVATATVTITQSDNQTIHVYTPQKSGGTDHTSTFTCPIGTIYEVEVIADSGYIAGIPNTTEGTFNSDMTINATPAEKAQIFVSKGSAPWYNNNSVDNHKWINKDKVISADESVAGQATVTCKDVTNMEYMFFGLSNLTSVDLSNFDTSKVTDMGFMLDNCSNLTSLDLSNFDTSNVTNMTSMFTKCSKLTSLDVSNFDTSNVRDMSMMFDGCSNLTSLDVTNFNTSKATDMREMFEKCSKLTSLDVTNFNTSKVTDMGEMFEDCPNLASLDVTNFDTSNADNMFFMFKGCSNLTSLDVTKFNTVKVRDMHGMFWDCSKLASIDVTNFDTSNVTDMGGMFASCGSFTSLNVSNFNTSKVTDMSYMFINSNLTSLDLSNFDTSNVTDMSRMFDGCPNLASLDLSNFNTSNVKDMTWMFENCANLVSLDLSNFNTSNVTEMGYMFDGCSNLTTLDLSDFDTSKVTYMNYMFFKCYNLTTIKGVIDMKSCTKYEGMFSNCPKLKDVKIKNPPADFESVSGLSKSQYTIVS